MEGKFDNEEREGLCNFIKSTDRFTNGPLVHEFEKTWSNWVGVKNSAMTNSGASGNYLSIAILKHLKGKGEVIVPSLGWSTDISSLIQLGLTPVFVDINPNNLCMDEKALENAITSKTIGVVLIHTLGFNGLSENIINICIKNNLFLIEDCCEAHGATFKDKRVGSFGNLSIFSFYYGHHISTIEGGMVCSKNDELHDLAKMFRSHGMIREASQELQNKYKNNYKDLNPLFTFAVPGFNLRSTEINAFIGLQQMQKIDLIIKKRSDNLNHWLKNLNKDKYFTNFNQEGSSNFALPLVLNEENPDLFLKLKSYLTKSEVEFRVGTAGGGNLARQPFVINNSHRISGTLKNTDKIHSYGLYVGNHENLNNENINRVVEAINEL